MATQKSSGGKNKNLGIQKPTKSKVSVFVYNIQYVDDPKLDDGERCFGYCDSDVQVITMDKNLNPITMKFFLIHEILESIFATYELELPHATIKQLGAYIAEYIEQNPDVIQYLTSK